MQNLGTIFRIEAPCSKLQGIFLERNFDGLYFARIADSELTPNAGIA